MPVVIVNTSCSDVSTLGVLHQGITCEMRG